MDWIEVTARSVAEAKELALDRLGVVEDELEYEVLDEPRRGMFGLGRIDARIRARVKPLSREKPTDRRRRRRSAERSTRESRSGSERSTAKRSTDAPDGDEGRATAASGSGTATGERSGSSRRRRRGGRRRGGRGGGGSGGGAGNGRRDGGARPEQQDDERPEVEVDTVPVAMQAEHAATFTEQLVRAMGFTATIRSEVDDEDVTVHIDGDELGPLVGPKGATLQALEEVVRAVVQHYAGGHSAWVHVDVGRYRERRREALAAFARKVATEVEETGESRALEPMNAADRKVVHDTLAELAGVTTGSEGEDPRRRVVIHPA